MTNAVIFFSREVISYIGMESCLETWERNDAEREKKEIPSVFCSLGEGRIDDAESRGNDGEGSGAFRYIEPESGKGPVPS